MEIISNLDDDQIVRKAFESSNPGMNIVATGKLTKNGNYCINLSDIFTKLIQETGRFVEQYASDLIIECDSIRDAAKCPADNQSQFFAIGLRKYGVDGNSYVVNNMRNDWNSEHYRRIYGIAITYSDDDAMHVELRDIQSEIAMLAYRMETEKRYFSRKENADVCKRN